MSTKESLKRKTKLIWLSKHKKDALRAYKLTINRYGEHIELFCYISKLKNVKNGFSGTIILKIGRFVVQVSSEYGINGISISLNTD